MPDPQSIPIDTAAYAERLRRDNDAGHCFICRIVEGRQPTSDIVVYRDHACVAFFPVPYRLLGYLLVAPLHHRRDVITEFTEEEYLALQRRIHRLGRAITGLVPTERLYVFSFGSHEGIDHVHWHLAPLPPGVPFDQQQFAAVDKPEQLDISDGDKVDLACQIADVMRETNPHP